ncbi:MAG: hypothetical protein JSV03_04115, partial [Planctomycetota bacterium]
MKRIRVMFSIAVTLLFTVSASSAVDGKLPTPVEGKPGQAANVSKATGEEINWQIVSSGGDIGGT